MTQYSIYSDSLPQNFANPESDNYLLEPDIPLQNLDNTTSETYSLEVDSDDWEVRMAKLVGLEAESLSADTEVLEESTKLQPSSEPTQEKTEQSLSSNPFAKLGLVGTATLAVVLFAGVFLSQLMSSSNQKPKNNNIVALETQSPTKQQSREQDLEENVETLKTKLALTEQAAAVKLAQQQFRNGKLIKVSQNSQIDNSRYGRTVVQRTPTPTATVYVPRIVTVERMVRSPYSQQPVAQSSVPPQALISNPQTQPSVNVTPPPIPNPLQDWERLSKLGSYGQVSVNNQSNANLRTTEEENNDRTQQATTNPKPEQTPKQQNSILSQGSPQSPKSIAVGSHAKAVLATAIFGETSKSTNGDRTNVFVVRLKEPLKTVDGAIAVPANTEFLTEISSLSEQGLVQLNVVKAILPTQGQLTEKSLPQNALMIRAPQGKPLIANQFPNRGSSIASMDVGLFVLGGFGKAAELVNRTESQVVTTNAGGTIVSNTNPQRNVLAGILEGGMNTVVPQIAQRNQQAISQMTQRTNVWFLPAGAAVEIYVNQAMEF
ncbi:MAG: TrbI/VirB10 family protein [Aulosira sp. ZfuVER01]|nr:TrbI/VirB10 family protein [Aulosira sp. ZfuVER01]MDZ8000279.1 TrbI/VirB10 family protein [Aulosira sp. DedVER01a]MDZ8054252.1 TrbI/VirB10 family protein [Aulosira sp. ZfuCHP01]